jgi:pantetheine-phosphate adenylyltransferase
MATALYPGTFDPITNGHIDIVARAARIFTKVIAVIADNPAKTTLFSPEERLDMAKNALAHVKNVEVIRYSGLIVNCMKECSATVIIRGLRALSDFEYEFQMAFTNRNMNDRAETVFLTPSVEFIYLNSTLVKQIAKHGGDIGAFVPPYVAQKVVEKTKKTAR